MSRQEIVDAERTIKTIVLCSMVGLVMGLGVATVIVYGEPSSDRSRPAGSPNDRPRELPKSTTERPPK